MPMDGTNGIGSYGSSSVSKLLDNLGTSAISPTGTQAGISTDTQSTLTAVSISAFGKQINAMYAELKEIEDPGQRESALAGMREVVKELASEGPGKMLDFVQSVNDLGQAGAADFFATANTVAQSGNNLGGFVNTFLALDSTEEQTAFVAAAEEIVEDETANAAEQRETFNRFLTAVNEIDTTEQTEEQRAGALSSFYDALRNQATIEAKNDFLTEYNSKPEEETAAEE